MVVLTSVNVSTFVLQAKQVVLGIRIPLPNSLTFFTLPQTAHLRVFIFILPPQIYEA
jgi:hypothetical protein